MLFNTLFLYVGQSNLHMTDQIVTAVAIVQTADRCILLNFSSECCAMQVASLKHGACPFFFQYISFLWWIMTNQQVTCVEWWTEVFTKFITMKDERKYARHWCANWSEACHINAELWRALIYRLSTRRDCLFHNRSEFFNFRCFIGKYLFSYFFPSSAE